MPSERLRELLRERFDIDLALKDFFADPTVTRVAESIDLARWMSEVPEPAGSLAEDEFGEI